MFGKKFKKDLTNVLKCAIIITVKERNEVHKNENLCSKIL